MKRIWKPIPQLAGKYEASNHGEIRHVVLKKVRILNVGKHGYSVFSFWNGKRPATFRAHILILSAFIPQPTAEHVPNHKNCVKSDNRLANLEWVTPAENRAHALENGRYLRGVKHPQSILTEQDVRNIRARHETESYDKLATAFKVSKPTIAAIITRRLWKHVT